MTLMTLMIGLVSDNATSKNVRNYWRGAAVSLSDVDAGDTDDGDDEGGGADDDGDDDNHVAGKL